MSDEMQDGDGRLNSTEEEDDGENSYCCEANDNAIDRHLEESAARNNLSILNVKSILHHVVKDKRVLALVQRRAAEEEGGQGTVEPGPEWDSDGLLAYEPKLTRSRVRQAVASSVATGAISPQKLVSLQKSLTSPVKEPTPSQNKILGVAFPEDSSDDDEEYDPKKETTPEGSESEEEEEESGGERGEGEGEEREEENGGGKEEEETCLAVSQGPEVSHAGISTTTTPTPSSDTSLQESPSYADSNSTIQSHSDSNSKLIPHSGFTLDETAVCTSSADSGGGEGEGRGGGGGGEPVCTTSGPSASGTSAVGDRGTRGGVGDGAEGQVALSLSEQETVALLASLSEMMSPVKQSASVGEPVPVHAQQAEQEEGEIAMRTRSKLPLLDTSISAIEASFVPPDVEDPPTPVELDEDDLEWQKWLVDVFNPADSPPNAQDQSVEMEEDDVEYNYLADLQCVEEKEEFRNDKAVRIPQKEVADLLDELLKPSEGGLMSGEYFDLTSAYLLESLGLQPPLLTQANSNSSTPAKANFLGSAYEARGGDTRDTIPPLPPPPSSSSSSCMTTEQMIQLNTQIQQHFQLLMQTFVLSRFDPTLVFLSQVTAQAIEEVKTWNQEYAEGTNSSVWYIPDMEEGVVLVKRLNPFNEESVNLVPSYGNPPKIPEPAQHIFMDTSLFWNYPELIPAIGFGLFLLVLGMSHYGPLSWKLIQENLLPTKTVKQLQLRVKNQCSSRTRGENPIKLYKKENKLKLPFRETKPLELPYWIIQYDKRRAEREKEEGKKRETELENSKKMVQLLDSVINKSPIKPSARAKEGSNQGRGSTPPPLTPPPPPSHPSQGTKRNLSSTFQMSENAERKRSKVSMAMTPADLPKGVERLPWTTRGRSKQVRKAVNPLLHKTTAGGGRLEGGGGGGGGGGGREEEGIGGRGRKRSRADMDYLMVAAGLEASDPSSRYAYNYLAQVKAALIDKEGQYEAFLQTLLEAKVKKSAPSEIYKQVQVVLRPWPHLVTLFTEFMDPSDCLEASALQDKCELESVKTFVCSLQEKFAGSPVKVDEVVWRLEGLQERDSEPSRNDVEDALMPLIEAHQELVDDMRRFLYSLAPGEVTEDVYEEVDLTGNDFEGEFDGFEDAALPASPPTKPKMASTPGSSVHPALPHTGGGGGGGGKKKESSVSLRGSGDLRPDQRTSERAVNHKPPLATGGGNRSSPSLPSSSSSSSSLPSSSSSSHLTSRPTRAMAARASSITVRTREDKMATAAASSQQCPQGKGDPPSLEGEGGRTRARHDSTRHRKGQVVQKLQEHGTMAVGLSAMGGGGGGGGGGVWLHRREQQTACGPMKAESTVALSTGNSITLEEEASGACPTLAQAHQGQLPTPGTGDGVCASGSSGRQREHLDVDHPTELVPTGCSNTNTAAESSRRELEMKGLLPTTAEEDVCGGSRAEGKDTFTCTDVAVRLWTREQDRIAIQHCQKHGTSVESFAKLANQLEKPVHQVTERHQELLQAFYSTYSK